VPIKKPRPHGGVRAGVPATYRGVMSDSAINLHQSQVHAYSSCHSTIGRWTCRFLAPRHTPTGVVCMGEAAAQHDGGSTVPAKAPTQVGQVFLKTGSNK